MRRRGAQAPGARLCAKRQPQGPSWHRHPDREPSPLAAAMTARGRSSQSHADYSTERTASRPGSQQPRPREGVPANPTLTMQPNVLRAGDGSRSEWRAVRCYGGGVRMCPKPQHGAIPACLIPKIVAICPVSNQDPKPMETQHRGGKEAVPLADLFVKPPVLRARLKNLL